MSLVCSLHLPSSGASLDPLPGANAGSASFIINKSDDVVFIAFSRAQAAASPSGLGRGFFEPVSLYSSTHKLFALLGRGEEDSGGKPQPVLLQAPYEEEAQCAALCKSDKVCMETIMHLTCMNMPVEKIDHALNTIKANGIQNVLALKGDPPHGQDKFVQVAGGFACALDLVQHIRAKYGYYFGITVAGYPKAHPDMIQGDEGATLEAYNSDLAYLKRKTLSVVLKFWKSFSHVKILELCEIFILWSANSPILGRTFRPIPGSASGRILGQVSISSPGQISRSIPGQASRMLLGQAFRLFPGQVFRSSPS
ncbi:hypothetical protein ZIOFF_021404 [Zingiber officinale]|uniref:Methylenetetrahydrofolate reductase n=1 Tax=Zingiber officinale TaxID=94328 RepID=A0A8J5H3T5_ZINOF|nr:hypothetical protein ZIOFF_021404 [Zingiber officinale]